MCTRSVNNIELHAIIRVSTCIYYLYTENPHLGSKLEDLQRSLKHNKQHLCQRLDEDQKIKKVSEPSVVDLLSCIQELEKERAGLMK